MKKLIIFLMFILSIVSVSALDECKAVVHNNEVPCEILLPTNVSITSCESINVTFYSNSTFLYSQVMLENNSFT